MFDEKYLLTDIKKMGIRPGDIVIVHASMKSVGPVKGGPQAVLRAFQQAVTPAGTIIMPAFSYCFERIYEQAQPYDPATTPSQTGLVSETFRKMKDVVRSFHPTHSVIAWGRLARELTAGHENLSGLAAGSPFHRAAQRNAKICMIGCGFTSLSLLHVAEDIAALPFLKIFNWWHRGWKPAALVKKNGRDNTRPSTQDAQNDVCMLEGHAPSCPHDNLDMIGIERKIYPAIPGCSKNFSAAQELAGKKGLIREGKLGNAKVLLADASTILDLTVNQLKKENDFLLCPAGTCRECDERRVIFAPSTPAEKSAAGFMIDVVTRAGIRLAGSEGEDKAAEIIADQMNEIGLSNIAIKRFPIQAWRPGFAELAVYNINGKWENIPAAPADHGPATPLCGIEGQAAILENAADIAKFLKSGAEIAVLWGSFGASAGEFRNLMNSAVKAFVYIDNRFEHSDLVSVGIPSQWIRYFKKPMVSVPFPDAVRIFGRGPTQCRLNVSGKTEPSTSSVVSGEIKGAGRGVILVSGHHDSTFNSPAPDDNLSGLAAMLAIARKLKGRRSLRHTIRFCSFGTEEILSAGARWYALESGLAQDVRFVVNNDSMGARAGVLDLLVTGSPALSKWVCRRIVGTTLQIQQFKEINPFSDHFPFNVLGIPSLWFHRRTTANARHYHHTARDTLSEISFEKIAKLAEFEADLIAELARREKFPFPLKFPPKLRAEVDKKRHAWLEG